MDILFYNIIDIFIATLIVVVVNLLRPFIYLFFFYFYESVGAYF